MSEVTQSEPKYATISLNAQNERCYYDSGQHAWQVTQTLKFGYHSLKPDRNMEIAIYIRSKSEL